MATVAACTRLRVEDRAPTLPPPTEVPPPRADRDAACDLARAAVRGESGPEATVRALDVLPCAPDDAALVAAMWDRIPADTAPVRALLDASRRAGGQAILDAALRTARTTTRPATARMAAVALAASYADPPLLVSPPDTVLEPRQRRVPPGTLLRLERAAINPAARYADEAPDSVAAMLAQVAKDDPAPAVRLLAATLRDDLAKRMKEKDWQLAERARRVGTEGTAAGCFALTLFAWPGDTAPGYTRAFRQPRRLELVAAPDSADPVPGARVLRPQVAGARGSWWVHAPDSITVRWASAESGLMLRLKVTPLNMAGTATAYTGPGGPELVTRTVLSRVTCGA